MVLKNTGFSDVHQLEGEIDVLIGLDYAAHHPQIVSSNRHLVISANRLGKCISGIHPTVGEKNA